MRMRTNGESRERLRQLLQQNARRFGLTGPAVDTLVRTAVLERWEAGDEIVGRGDGQDVVSFVVVGSVKVVCPCPRGTPVLVCFGAPGQFVATGGIFDGHPVRRELRVVAHDHLGTTVATWSQTTVTELMATLPPSLALQVMAYGWRAFSSLVREKCHLLAFGLKDRVLAALGTLARDFGVPHPDGVLVNLRLTHADLAGLAVGSRANVTRALDELRREGLVACERHRIVLTFRALGAGRAEAVCEPPTTACG